MANGFLTVVNGDGEAALIQSSVSTTGQCPDNPGGLCDEAGVLGGSGGVPAITFRDDTTEHDAHPGGRYGNRVLQPGRFMAAYRKSVNHQSGSSSVIGADGTVDVGGPDCLDIARSINYFTPQWETARKAVADAVKALFMGYIPSIENGGLKFNAPVAGALDVNLEAVMAQAATVKTQLDIYATMYSYEGCWSNTWVDAQDSQAANEFGLVCYTEDWSISFDSGDTWQPLYVRVCKFPNQT